MSKFLLAAQVGLLLFGSTMSSALGVVLQPTEPTGKDVFVYQGFPNHRMDTNATLTPNFFGGFGDVLGASATTTGHDTETLIRFDVASTGLTAAQTPVSKLRLYARSGQEINLGQDPVPGSPVQIDVYQAAADWDELDVYWNNRPASTGGIVASATFDQVNQWIEWDVSSLVNSWQNNPATNFGFLLRMNTPVGSPGLFKGGVFYSSNAADPSLAPMLLVPEPATMTLSLVAAPLVAAMFWIRRRRSVSASR